MKHRADQSSELWSPPLLVLPESPVLAAWPRVLSHALSVPRSVGGPTPTSLAPSPNETSHLILQGAPACLPPQSSAPGPPWL